MSHIYAHRNFMIFNVSELEQVNFDEVLETSAETVRKSIDGSMTFVKWDGEVVPSSINNLTTKQGPYSYEEILTILSGSEWSSSEITQ